jgi:hypothetical protein
MIDTDKYEGVKGSLVHIISNEVWVTLTPAAQALIADAPLLFAEVKRLSAEVRRLRDMVCLLEDSRITNMSILDRPELFADVAEVFRQRKEDTHGHLPNFGEE